MPDGSPLAGVDPGALSTSLLTQMQSDWAGLKEERSEHLAAFEKAQVAMQDAAPQPQRTPPQEYSGAAMAIAALGGLLTRHPVTVAAQSMAGVLDAYQKGDAEKSRQNYETWKAAHDAAVKSAELELKAYEDAGRQMSNDPRGFQAMMLAQTAAFKNMALNQMASEGRLGDLANAVHALRTKVGAANKAGQGFTYVHDAHMGVADAEQAVTDAAKSGDREAYSDAIDKLNEARQELATRVEEGQARLPKGVTVAELRKPIPGGSVPKSGLSGAALDKASEYYHTTHILPPGFGAQADKDAIQNREAELYPDGGKDTAERVASFKSNSAALTMLTKQKESAEAYERSAGQELDLAVSLIPKTPEPLNMQILTDWARTGATQFGDVQVPQFQAALISGLTEYAKVLSGATGSVAASTDAARNEALSLIPRGATSDQIPGIVEVIKKGMGFKLSSYDKQVQKIRAELGGAAQPAAAEQPSSTPAKITGDEDYEKLPSGTVFVGPDGVTRKKP